MDNTIFRHKSFTGNFARVHAGIRLSQNTHSFATEAAAAINADPKNTLNWLMLADRLEEEGNPAHHMIRAVFVDGYEVPKGFSGSINRSYYCYLKQRSLTMWDDDFAGDEYGQDYNDLENWELDRLAEDAALERECDDREEIDYDDGIYPEDLVTDYDFNDTYPPDEPHDFYDE